MTADHDKGSARLTGAELAEMRAEVHGANADRNHSMLTDIPKLERLLAHEAELRRELATAKAERDLARQERDENIRLCNRCDAKIATPCSDQPLPEDEAIKAAHPTRTGRHDLYAEEPRSDAGERGLTFAKLREENVARCEESFYQVDSRSPTDWATAIAEECGEVARIAKRIRDGKFDANVDVRREMGHELADMVMYIDLMAARFGIDLGGAVIEKFAIVSRRVRSARRLSVCEAPRHGSYICTPDGGPAECGFCHVRLDEPASHATSAGKGSER